MITPKKRLYLFNSISNMFSAIFDEMYAPADALSTSGTIDHFASDMDVSPFNGFGTLNDFEVPASSCDITDPFAGW